MARGKSGSNSTPRISTREANELIKRVPLSALSAFIAKQIPESEPKFATPTTLRMHCLLPGHPDVHPSFIVDQQQGVARCKPCGYRSRNILQVLQDSKAALGYGESLRALQATTGERLVPERLESQYEALDQHHEAVRAIAWAVNTYLVNMLAPPEGDDDYNELARLTAQPTLDWLFSQRGHDPGLVHTLPIGLWPPLDTLTALCERRLLALSSEAYVSGGVLRYGPERREKILTRISALVAEIGAEHNHSVVYITGHDVSTPARIRLRRPDSNNVKDGNITVLPGYTPEESNGFFGLYAPHLAAMSRREARSLQLLVVEGENDAHTITEGLLNHAVTGWLVVATCGIAGRVDELVGAGFDTAYFLHDHPSPEYGRGEVWLFDRLGTCETIIPRVFSRWDALVAGNALLKDPDDVIRALGFDHFQSHALTDIDRTFAEVEVWALDRAKMDAQGVEEPTARLAIAARFGEKILNPAKFARYVDDICTALGLTPAVVRAHVVKGQDSEVGFVKRISETMCHEFLFRYKEDTARGTSVYAYHRATRRPVTFAVGDGASMLMALSNVFGDMHAYFKERIGIPTCVEDPAGTGTPPTIREIQKVLADYLKIAMQAVFQGVPARLECTTIGVGPKRVEENGQTVQYLNTGSDVYRADYRSDGTLAWRRLDGPQDGKLLFTLSQEPYHGEVQSVADLEDANRYTLDDIRGAILDLQRHYFPCWKLKHGDADYALLALIIACLCSPHFREDKIFLYITGLSNSGKSALAASTCSGQYPELQLVDYSRYMTNFSPASVAHLFNFGCITPMFEEFTSDGVHEQKSHQVDNISELLRQAIYPGGIRLTRVYNGTPTEFVLHMDAIATSTHPPRDVQDANRILTIETVRSSGHQDPRFAVFQKLSPARIKEIKRILNLGLFKFADAYAEHHKTVVAEIAQNQIADYQVESRFARNFFGPCTMLALIGGDWRPFYKACVTVRRDSQILYANATPNNILFETILRTNSVRIGTAFTSPLALLAEADKTPLLNSTNQGAVYCEAGGYLVVDWIAITSHGGVLHRTNWSNEEVHRLKYQLDMHVSALPSDQYAARGVFAFLGAVGNSAQAHNISVLAIKPLVDSLRAANLRTTSLGEKSDKGGRDNVTDLRPASAGAKVKPPNNV